MSAPTRGKSRHASFSSVYGSRILNPLQMYTSYIQKMKNTDQIFLVLKHKSLNISGYSSD